MIDTASMWHATTILLLSSAVHAAVVDRIAVTVGQDAITESEVRDEIRVAAFFNNEPLDFSPSARRSAAERLVDQYLIRRELATGTYPPIDPARGEQLVRDFEKQHFRSRADMEQKLQQYGLTVDDLKEHLLFQAAAVQFTDLRFASEPRNEADRTVPGATPSPSVDEQLDTWLKQVRGQTRIEYKKEAFE